MPFEVNSPFTAVVVALSPQSIPQSDPVQLYGEVVAQLELNQDPPQLA